MVQDYVAVYSERRDYMYRRLRSLGFEIFGGNGGYMCWVDVTSGSGLSAAEFQLGLLKVAGVQLGGMGWNDRTGREPPPPPRALAALPLGLLRLRCRAGYMRLSFLQPMEKLAVAFDAIEEFTLSLNGGSKL